MKAGLLNEKISITRFDKTKNDYGEEIISYTYLGDFRAGVIHSPTSLTNLNNEISYPYSKNIVVRKYVDVREDDEVVYNGKRYFIESIEPNREFNNKVLIVKEKQV